MKNIKNHQVSTLTANRKTELVTYWISMYAYQPKNANMYSCCYVWSVPYILFSLCCSMYCLFVNVYCIAATACQPDYI